MFFNLNVIEYYPSSPIKGFDDCFSDFRGCEIFEVPVLRIFGSTFSGKKGCVHVHGVFPYFSVRWKDAFPDIEVSDWRSHTQKLAFEIDRALNVSARKSSSSRHHVFNIVPFKGVHFYGYHPQKDDFIRIYFYNPYDVAKTVEIMTNGGILNKTIQPYESHIPYILQFMIDHNVSRTLKISNYKLRASHDSNDNNSHSTVRPSDFASMGGSNLSMSVSPLESGIEPATYCEVELDCCRTDILNNLKRASSEHSNPGIALIWEEEALRRKLINPEAEITQAHSQGMRNEELSEKELQYFKILRQKVYDTSAGPSLNLDVSTEDETTEGVEVLDSQLSSSFYDVIEELRELHRDCDNSVLQPVGGIGPSREDDSSRRTSFLEQSLHGPCEEDSILGSKPEEDEEEDENYTTVEMSQRFLPDLPTGTSLDSSITEVAADGNGVVQLDGAFDEDSDSGRPVLSIEESPTYPENSRDSFNDEPPVLEPVQPLSQEASIYIKKYSLKPCCVEFERHPFLEQWVKTNPGKPLPLTLLTEKGILPLPELPKAKFQGNKTKLKHSRNIEQMPSFKSEVKSRNLNEKKMLTYKNEGALSFDNTKKIPTTLGHASNKLTDQVYRTMKNNSINVEKNNLQDQKPESTSSSLYSNCDRRAANMPFEGKPSDSQENLESLKPLVIKLERLDTVPSGSLTPCESLSQKPISESKQASDFTSTSKSCISSNPVNAQIKNNSKTVKKSKSYKEKLKLSSPYPEKKKECSPSKKNFLKKSAKTKRNPYKTIALKVFPNDQLVKKSSISQVVEDNESDIADEVRFTEKPDSAFSKNQEADSKQISKHSPPNKLYSSKEKKRGDSKFRHSALKENCRLSSSHQSQKGINFKVLENFKDINLSKLGREVVLVKRLTQEDIDRFCSKENDSKTTSEVLGSELFLENYIPISLESFQNFLSCNNFIRNFLQTKKICRKPKLHSRRKSSSINPFLSKDTKAIDSSQTSLQIKGNASCSQVYQFIRARYLQAAIFSNTMETLIQNEDMNFVLREGYNMAIDKEATSSALEALVTEHPSQICSFDPKSNSYMDDEEEDSNQSFAEPFSFSSIMDNFKESSFFNLRNQHLEEELAGFDSNNLFFKISSDSRVTKKSSKCTLMNQQNELNISWSDSKIITISTKSNSSSQYKVPANVYDSNVLNYASKYISSCSQFREVSQFILYSAKLTADCYKNYLLYLNCKLNLLHFFSKLSMSKYNPEECPNGEDMKVDIFGKLFSFKRHSSANVSSAGERKLDNLALESSLNNLKAFNFGGKTIVINDANLSNVMKTIMSLSSFSRLTNCQWVIMQYCPHLSVKSNDSEENNNPATAGGNASSHNVTGVETSTNPSVESVENAPVESRDNPTPPEKESKSNSNPRSDGGCESNQPDTNYSSNSNSMVVGSATCMALGGPTISAVNVLASAPITNCKLPSEMFSPGCSKPFQNPLPFAVKSKPFKTKANHHLVDKKSNPHQNVIARKSKPFILPVASTSRTVQGELPNAFTGRTLSNKKSLKNASNLDDQSASRLKVPLSAVTVQSMPFNVDDISKLSVDLNPRVVLSSDLRDLSVVGNSTGTERDFTVNAVNDDRSRKTPKKDHKGTSEPSRRNESSASGPSKSDSKRKGENKSKSSDRSKMESNKEKTVSKMKGPVLSNFSAAETTVVGNDLYDNVKRRTASKSNPHAINIVPKITCPSAISIVPKTLYPMPSLETNNALPCKLPSKDKPDKSEVASTSKYYNSERTDKKSRKGQSNSLAQSFNQATNDSKSSSSSKKEFSKFRHSTTLEKGLHLPPVSHAFPATSQNKAAKDRRVDSTSNRSEAELFKQTSRKKRKQTSSSRNQCEAKKVMSSKLSLKQSKKEHRTKEKNSNNSSEAQATWKIDEHLKNDCNNSNNPQPCSSRYSQRSSQPSHRNASVKIEPPDDYDNNEIKVRLSAYEFDDSECTDKPKFTPYLPSVRKSRVPPSKDDDTDDFKQAKKGKKHAKEKRKKSKQLELKKISPEKKSSDISRLFTDFKETKTQPISKEKDCNTSNPSNVPQADHLKNGTQVSRLSRKCKEKNQTSALPSPEKSVGPLTIKLNKEAKKSYIVNSEKLDSNSDSPEFIEKPPELKIKIKKQDDSYTVSQLYEGRYIIKNVCPDVDILVPIPNLTEPENKEQKKKQPKRGRAEKTPENPGPEKKLPVDPKDIKKEPEDKGYDKQLVPPLKLSLTPRKATCDSQEKIEKLKLCQNSGSYYVGNCSAKRKIEDSDASPVVKRRRGRPAKVDKLASPEKNGGPSKQETPAYLDVKIKQEVISDDENTHQGTSAQTTRRRRSSTKVDNYYESSDGGSSPDEFLKGKAGRKKKRISHESDFAEYNPKMSENRKSAKRKCSKKDPDVEIVHESPALKKRGRKPKASAKNADSVSKECPPCTVTVVRLSTPEVEKHVGSTLKDLENEQPVTIQPVVSTGSQPIIHTPIPGDQSLTVSRPVESLSAVGGTFDMATNRSESKDFAICDRDASLPQLFQQYNSSKFSSEFHNDFRQKNTGYPMDPLSEFNVVNSIKELNPQRNLLVDYEKPIFEMPHHSMRENATKPKPPQQLSSPLRPTRLPEQSPRSISTSDCTSLIPQIGEKDDSQRNCSFTNMLQMNPNSSYYNNKFSSGTRLPFPSSQPDQAGFFGSGSFGFTQNQGYPFEDKSFNSVEHDQFNLALNPTYRSHEGYDDRRQDKGISSCYYDQTPKLDQFSMGERDFDMFNALNDDASPRAATKQETEHFSGKKEASLFSSFNPSSSAIKAPHIPTTLKQDMDPFKEIYIKEHGYSPGGQYGMRGSSPISPSAYQGKPISPSMPQGKPFSPLAFQAKPSSPYMRDNMLASRKLDFGSDLKESSPKNSIPPPPSTSFSQESMNFNIGCSPNENLASKSTQGKPYSPSTYQGNPFSPSPQGKPFSPSSQGKPFSPSGQVKPFTSLTFQAKPSSPYNMMVSPKLDPISDLNDTFSKSSNHRPPSASFSQDSVNFNMRRSSNESLAGSSKGTQGKPYSPSSYPGSLFSSSPQGKPYSPSPGQGNSFLSPACQMEPSPTFMRDDMMPRKMDFNSEMKEALPKSNSSGPRSGSFSPESMNFNIGSEGLAGSPKATLGTPPNADNYSTHPFVPAKSSNSNSVFNPENLFSECSNNDKIGSVESNKNSREFTSSQNSINSLFPSESMECENSNISSPKLKMEDDSFFVYDINNPGDEAVKESPVRTEVTSDENGPDMKMLNFQQIFEDTDMDTSLDFDIDPYNFKNSITSNADTTAPIAPPCENLQNSHLESTKELQDNLYLFSNTTQSQETSLSSMLAVSSAPNYTQCTSTVSASVRTTSGINNCSPVLPFNNNFLTGNILVPFSTSELNTGCTVAVDNSPAISQLFIPQPSLTSALLITLPHSNVPNRLTGANDMGARQDTSNIEGHFNQEGQEDILSCIMKQCDIEAEYGDEDINTIEANQKNLCDLNAKGMSVPAPITDQVNLEKSNLTCVQSTQPDMISSASGQYRVSRNPKSLELLSDSDSQFSSAGVTSPKGEDSQVASTKLTASDHTSDINESVGSPAIFPCSPDEVSEKNSRPSQEQKMSSDEEEEDLDDSVVHSFYGEDTIYGLHPSVNCSSLLSDSQSFINVPAIETPKRFEESQSKQEDKNTTEKAKSSQTSAFKSDDTSSVMLPTESLSENYSNKLHPFKSQNAATSLKPFQIAESDSSTISHCKPPNQDPTDWTEFPNKKFATHSDSSDADSSDESQNLHKEQRKGSPEMESENIQQESSTKGLGLWKSPSKTSSTPQVKFRDIRNMASTPSTSRIKDNFLSMELGVSPINNNSTLTSGTTQKRRRKLSFERSLKKPVNLESSGSSQMGWLANQTKDGRPNTTCSEIEGPSLENTAGFKVNFDETNNEVQVRHEVQLFTIMSLEVHVNTRNDLCPDPNWDSITAIFYSIYNHTTAYKQEVVGMIAVMDSSTQAKCPGGVDASLKNLMKCSVPEAEKCTVHCVESEALLFDELIRVVRKWDPDILLGYEIQMASWGFLIQRASYKNIDMTSKLSRIREKREDNLNKTGGDSDGTLQTAGLDQINIPGRITLNVWRLMRKEVSLDTYSFDNVCFHVLHSRTPLFSFESLTSLYQGPKKGSVIRYYTLRVLGSVQLLEKFDMIRRTSEMACLFGIQFYDVLNRGSQFRVESMMLRSAAAMHYVPVSPTVQQRAHSRAPECVPLILEPESKFYKDPVVVLDFQSLYPSMIIAYNYCFSTCLGRVEHLGRDDVPFEFGCTSLSVHPNVLRELMSRDGLHVSPQGVAFVKQSVRRGILPRMLEEILNTRIMVKQSMKKAKGQGHLRKLLEARQMALKLIANVTYGYTAASFSGRMPNVEVADSIVGKGRETLERAIRLIENTPKWNAKVVYGDTDSVFILLKGRTKEEAFKIGQEMADAVTETNPRPVKLKFEKVYLPCILQTKKRYVGFMYETVDQEKPVFDAKGIETVRRDTCPAAAKILEKSIRRLFESYDISRVQKYVQKQFQCLLSGRSSIKDCIFAKEFRGLSGYRPGACVPALEIARNRLNKDPRSAPRVGERVPYVVVYGYPGLPIIRLVREPTDLKKDLSLRVNAIYYITRVIIPPLERVFNLVNTDVKVWYANIARTTKLNLPMIHDTNLPKETITQYFVSKSCPSCENPTSSPVCDACLGDLQGTVVALNDKIRKWERKVAKISSICMSCTKFKAGVDMCMSIACPVLFKLNLAKRDLSQAPYVRRILWEELF